MNGWGVFQKPVKITWKPEQEISVIEDDQEIILLQMKTKKVQVIEPHVHKETKPYDGKEECAICMNSIDQIYSESPLKNCNHICFHVDCIDSWLKLRQTCPLCRSHAK